MQKEASKQTITPLNAAAQPATETSKIPPKPQLPNKTSKVAQSQQQLGFKYTTKKYEPDFTDEALEKMVPPPKRLIKEDTPVTATAAPDQSYSIANMSYRQNEEEKRNQISREPSPKQPQP